MTITKKVNSENKAFWESAREARGKVETWPDWKRNLKVTQYSVGFDAKSSEASLPKSEKVCSRK